MAPEVESPTLAASRPPARIVPKSRITLIADIELSDTREAGDDRKRNFIKIGLALFNR